MTKASLHLSLQYSNKTSENGRSAAAKKTTGCMSGILHLLSRHSRKRLPSGKKRDKAIRTPGRILLPSEKSRRQPLDINVLSKSAEHSTVIPNPTVDLLPPELHRQPGSPAADSPRRSPALVARLMGLDEMVLVQSPDSAAEKRRRLLGALEKCTEDLDALRRIIEAVQLAEAKRQPVVVPNSNGTKLLDGGDAVTSNEQQPSPVSVLHALSSPPGDRSVDSRPCELLTTRLNTAEGHHMKKTRNTGETLSFVRRIVIEEPEHRVYRSVEEFGFPRTTESGPRQWRGQRSRAMVEAVCEVCEDGVREERWEFGRVGFELEVAIFGGLVEELVVGYLFSLPLRTSRKRLYF